MWKGVLKLCDASNINLCKKASWFTFMTATIRQSRDKRVYLYSKNDSTYTLLPSNIGNGYDRRLGYKTSTRGVWILCDACNTDDTWAIKRA